jgi:L-fucose isomerase-like protein
LDETYDNDYKFDKKALNDSLRLKKTLEIIKNKYKLNGLTIRCFDLLSSIGTTACLSLALFNKDKFVSTCEGDIPAMISMHVLKEVCNQVGFQANPSRIDVVSKNMVLAHCTLPFDMVSDYKLDTHFESGIGVAVRGKMKEDKITIFKLSKNLKDYFVTTGKIVQNLDEDNLCRTQIKILVDENIEYFLNRPYGNHHIIIYGDHREDIINYMKRIG